MYCVTLYCLLIAGTSNVILPGFPSTDSVSVNKSSCRGNTMYRVE